MELEAGGVAVPMTLSEFAMKAQRGWVLTGSPIVTIELPPGLATAAASTGATTPDNLFRTLDFKTEAEVVGIVGEPAAKWQKPDRLIWLYDDVVPGLAGESSQPELQFIDGQVRAIVFMSSRQMADRMATARLHEGWTPHAGPRPRTMTLDEISQLTAGRTRDDVVAALGEPNEKQALEGREGWIYEDLVVDAGRTRRIVVTFDGDAATGIEGG